MMTWPSWDLHNGSSTEFPGHCGDIVTPLYRPSCHLFITRHSICVLSIEIWKMFFYDVVAHFKVHSLVAWLKFNSNLKAYINFVKYRTSDRDAR